MEATTRNVGIIGKQAVPEAVKMKYCLYARKSTESEERQVLSIDSQIKEMLQLSEREGLEIVAMKRESHSAKETGQRPVFNEIIDEIKAILKPLGGPSAVSTPGGRSFLFNQMLCGSQLSVELEGHKTNRLSMRRG